MWTREIADEPLRGEGVIERWDNQSEKRSDPLLETQAVFEYILKRNWKKRGFS